LFDASRRTWRFLKRMMPTAAMKGTTAAKIMTSEVPMPISSCAKRMPTDAMVEYVSE